MADETQTNTTEQTAEPTSQTAENPQNITAIQQEGDNSAKQETTPRSAEKTFTQDELNKIIADRLKSEQKRWEKKAADEKAEAERVAKMTADEKAKHEQEKREREFAEHEAAFKNSKDVKLANLLIINLKESKKRILMNL